jgi:hypothetical protein
MIFPQETLLEIMPRCFAAGLYCKIAPAGFNPPMEFLTGQVSGFLFNRNYDGVRRQYGKQGQ